MDVDGEDGTPVGSGGEDDEEDPQSLDEDDMDPINSGAVTPGVGAAPSAAGGKTGLGQFTKRKETKVSRCVVCFCEAKLGAKVALGTAYRQ